MKRIKYLVLIIAVLFMFSCINKSQNSSNMIGERTMKAKEKYKELLNRDFAVSKEDEDLQNIFNNFVYGEVYNHGNLEPKLRELITLVSLTASDGNNMIAEHVEVALNVGASAIEIKEALYRCAPYVGFPRVFTVLEEANKIFKYKNIKLPLPSQATVSDNTRFEKGLEIQTNTFGQRILDAHANAPEKFKAYSKLFVGNVFWRCFIPREGLEFKNKRAFDFYNVNIFRRSRASSDKPCKSQYFYGKR